MAPEASATSPSPRRPRTSLLVLLGAAAVLFALTRIWTGNPATPAARPSNPRAQAKPGAPGAVDPAELDVRLEELSRNGGESVTAGRNPFRFGPPPAPP